MTRLTTIALAGLCMFFASCSPTTKLKRAKRLIALAEAQGAVWKTDTLWQTKTVIVPETHFDTVLRQVNFRDTIIVQKDKVVTKLKIDTVRKEIFVSTDCPPDTVVVKVPVEVNRELSAPGYTKFGMIWRVGLGFIVGLIVGYIVRSVTKII